MSRSAARFAVLALVFAAAACEKVALLAPTGSTVTLTVSTTSLSANGTAQVLATVIEAGGTPVHNGTEVRFQASVGVVEPAVARTENGVAISIFRGNGASGTAKVSAFSGGAKSTEVEVRVGSAAAETVSVRTDPGSVSQTGGSVQVIAVVRDLGGSSVTGAQVVFSSDNGVLSSGNAITDERGEARVTLTTSRETNVRANVAGKEGTARVTVVNLPTASIAISPPNPSVGQTVTITVTPGATTNGNPIRDVTIDFGDNSSQSLGAITSATPASHVYTRAGDYTITVTTTDTAGQRTTSSAVLNVQPSAMSVTISGTPNPAGAGTAVAFTVAVANPTNVPLAGVDVNFGDGTSTRLGPTGGSTSHVYNNTGGSPVIFNATATVSDLVGNRSSSSAQITVLPRAAVVVTLDATVSENASAFTCSTAYPKTCRVPLSAFVPPPGGQTGVRITFTAALTAGFGGGGASRYFWDLNNDGVVDRETTGNSIDQVFVAPGVYVVRVRVTTTDGNFGEQYITIEVNP